MSFDVTQSNCVSAGRRGRYVWPSSLKSVWDVYMILCCAGAEGVGAVSRPGLWLYQTNMSFLSRAQQSVPTVRAGSEKVSVLPRHLSPCVEVQGTHWLQHFNAAHVLQTHDLKSGCGLMLLKPFCDEYDALRRVESVRYIHLLSTMHYNLTGTHVGH